MSDATHGNWLARKPAYFRPRARLFCFPYAGVGTSAYRHWAGGLPADLEVCAVQFPGRESRLREPPYTRIDKLVGDLLPALLPCLDLPFALFGHSMGAVVASEVAVALAASGAPLPQHLFLSARRGPRVPDPDPPISALSDAAFVAEIQRRYGGIPAEVLQDQEMMALLLPGLRADIAALESYRPSRDMRIGCPLSVFGGDQDRRAPPEHLEDWRESASAGFRLRVFPGGHFYLNACRAEVLTQIASSLAAICGGTADTAFATGGA